MRKKDDSSNILLMILSMPVLVVVFIVKVSAMLVFIMAKNFFEFCWMLLKMPYESWQNRKNGRFKSEIIQWLLIIGFILLCIFAITADIRSGGKYSREGRSRSEYWDNVSRGAGVGDL